MKTFGSTQEFLANWSEDMPGCLVLDVRLPGMTGIEFQEQLARSGIHIPIVFMTAHGDVPMVRKVMKAGAIEFLTKPFQREELLHGIGQALESDRARRVAGNRNDRSGPLRIADCSRTTSYEHGHSGNAEQAGCRGLC